MLNKLMKLKNKKGFTLVELIVVIAIIAILTAIIVPLVGRYSAQARYTTLNDAATTISNSINSGLSDANQIGVINVPEVTGNKTGGTLTVKVGDAESKTGTAATAGTDAEKRAADRIVAALGDALPDNCCFYASVHTSTVSGVVYFNAGTSLPLTVDKDTTNAVFENVPDFDNAYQSKAKEAEGDEKPAVSAQAVGLTGKYIPAKS